MSVTTSTNTVSQSVLRLLADYELHHSEDFVEPGVIEGQNPRPEPRAQNPEWWPTDHHRIPDHRPINRNLDRELRPMGTFFMERCFILTMLGGCMISANVSTLWRQTGGRINDRIFRYPIGGEK